MASLSFQPGEVEERRWQRLEFLLQQFDAESSWLGWLRAGSKKGIPLDTVQEVEPSTSEKTLPDRLRELASLYRHVLSDLAKSQTAPCLPEVRDRLNRLAGRAYSRIYQRPGVSFFDSIMFFLETFPTMVRQRFHYVSTAILVFLCASLVGFLCLSLDSKLIDLVVPKAMKVAMEQDISQGKIGRAPGSFSRFKLSSEILFHNIEVSFLAFGTGFLCGIGTLWLLMLNGLLMGGLAAIYHQAGFAVQFWSLILPHGAIELPCIFISAAAGLMIGYALLNPGPYSRRDVLAREGFDAVKLVVGTLPFYAIAGLVETFVTPSSIAIPIKCAIGICLFLLVCTYLGVGGRWKLKDLAELETNIRRQKG